MSDIAEFRYIKKAERDAIPDEDFGYVNGDRRLFPIQIQDDVMAAARLIGRAKGLSDADRDAVKAKIIKIAKRKGFDIPKTWLANMSEDLAEQITENILFNAELDERFDLVVDDKVYTIQIVDIRTIN